MVGVSGDRIQRLNGTREPWFVDEEHLTVFKGADYGYGCVCAIGPRDFSTVTLRSTQNPRRLLWKVQREQGRELVVHEALWSPGRSSDSVLHQIEALVTKAALIALDRWTRFPRRFLLPLLEQAAQKAGVTGMRHSAFAAFARQRETDKLRRSLEGLMSQEEIEKCRIV